MQSVEAPFPELAVARDPVGRFAHGCRHEAAVVNASVPVAREQARPFEHLQVLRDRGQRHHKRPRELAHGRLGRLGEAGEDRPPRRIRQGSEGCVERAGIVNHSVNYIAAGTVVKPSGEGSEAPGLSPGLAVLSDRYSVTVGNTFFLSLRPHRREKPVGGAT